MTHYTIGDIHGEINYLTNKNFPEQKELTKDNILFFLGDFGLYWYYPQVSELYKKDYNKRKELATKKFTSFIIPGNHENYDLINELPIIEKWGGKVFVDEYDGNFLYIACRGEIYLIDGKTIFTFSGALSSDIEDRNNIDELNTYKKVKKYRYGQLVGVINKKVKIGSISHWKSELPTEEEYNYGLENLSKLNYNVDYIFSHTCPNSIIEEFIHQTEFNFKKFECPVSLYFDEVNEKVFFKKWFFGHLHTNYIFDDFICHFPMVGTKPISIEF